MYRCPVVVCLVAVAACGSSGAEEPQLPCATSAYQTVDGVRFLVETKHFEYDELGHPTHEIVDAGGVASDIVRVFDGDHPILMEGSTGDGRMGRYEAAVVDGRVVTSTWTAIVGQSSTGDYTATWTWGPNGVETYVRDIVGASAPEETTCTASPDGYECVSCQNGCSRWYVVGAEYVGDGLVFEMSLLAGDGRHQGIWTDRGTDIDDDGTLDYRETRTLDAHGLPLTYRSYTGSSVRYREDYTRDADGTARSLVRTTSDATVEVEFDYECGTEISP